MQVIVTAVALGHWYPHGVERLKNEFRHQRNVHVQAWVNALPPGAQEVKEDGWDYTAYAAKPFALRHALELGADVAILCDASFYPIRSIQPLVDHIMETGHYLCRNGYTVSEWTSDRCLESMSIPRDSLRGLEDISSYCVGVRKAEKIVVPEEY